MRTDRVKLSCPKDSTARILQAFEAMLNFFASRLAVTKWLQFWHPVRGSFTGTVLGTVPESRVVALALSVYTTLAIFLQLGE